MIKIAILINNIFKSFSDLLIKDQKEIVFETPSPKKAKISLPIKKKFKKNFDEKKKKEKIIDSSFSTSDQSDLSSGQK